MERLLIVDGMNLLFQMYYGMPARIINAQGKAIQGTLGFVGALLKIIRMVQPTHLIIPFDGECCNPRKELDADYKANRPQLPEEDSPFTQLPDVYRALDYLGIRYAETTDCEADDWIAGYAKKFGGEMEIVIASQDSDFFQLITEQVCVLRYRGDRTVCCDRKYILDRLGIAPEQYAAFKSLTGDTADNIRGADKVGPKTAAELMNQFGSLEAMFARAEQIRKPSVRESVLRNRERIRLNALLIRLDGAEELPFDLDEMVYRDSGYTTTDVLKGIGLR